MRPIENKKITIIEFDVTDVNVRTPSPPERPYRTPKKPCLISKEPY